ncbi:MAG: hypothetical protein LW875_08320 [Proteobacteria bacterium]|nr:hypothetical protein [Pseudomonadota bacterium]
MRSSAADKSVILKKPEKKSGLDILGTDLSRKYQSRGRQAWRPTKPGGRMKSGKPS